LHFGDYLFPVIAFGADGKHPKSSNTHAVAHHSQARAGAMKKRSVIKRDLRTPKYRPRVVKSKKVYNRKKPERSQ
jgi:hypothetical protein